MSESAPLDRRQWLKAAGGAVAGAVLVSRSPGATGAPEPEASRPAPDATTPPPESRGERRYVMGFEDYPPV
jgi:hypothetical protein